MSAMIELRKPYLLFVGDAPTPIDAKTAAGIAHWRRTDCLAQVRLTPQSADLGLPDLSIADAAAQGAGTLIVGVAPVGGGLPDPWIAICVEALDAGMDIAAGLHTRLAQIPDIAAAILRSGNKVLDVREPPSGLPCGTGKRRAGRRLLTVGTDCCVGKMYSALAIQAEMRDRGISSTFRATGQTGILIEGTGIAIDAVVSDFLSGATETLCPANSPDHWDIIEGQGSLFHPAYAAVSLGLLHGAQADLLVLCHELGRSHIDGDYPDYPIPELETVISTNLGLARRTNPNAQLLGLSVNSSRLDEAAAMAEIADLEKRIGLPVTDPVRTGAAKLVDRLEAIT